MSLLIFHAEAQPSPQHAKENKKTQTCKYIHQNLKKWTKMHKNGAESNDRIRPHCRSSFFFLSALMMLSDFCMRAFS